jgi:hypothetical protein
MPGAMIGTPRVHVDAVACELNSSVIENNRPHRVTPGGSFGYADPPVRADPTCFVKLRAELDRASKLRAHVLPALAASAFMR